MSSRTIVMGVVLCTAMAAGTLLWAQVSLVDPKLPKYQAVSGIAGNLNSIGSDTMNNLVTLLAEGFKKFYPNVNIQIEGKGSSTAPPALISGTAQLGPMSREMKASEIAEFERKFGYKPTPVIVAVDALAVYVHRDNPIACLTIPQVDAIFSSTRRCGHPRPIDRWGDLGLTGPWAAQPIRLYGRNAASGTYGYFKEHALCNGDFRNEVKELPGSATVVQSVAKDRFGIGYSGIGYRTPGVRAVPLASKEGEPCVEATSENALSGKYPLARPLYIYVNKAPNRPLDPLVREFLRFALSREGQEAVAKSGFTPVPRSVADRELAKVGVEQLAKVEAGR